MSENGNISLDKAEVSEYRLTPFETFIKFLVVSFIWGGLFFVPGFIIGILKSYGIIIGMIPTILIYAPFGYLIKKSTEKWFRYYKERRSKKHQKQSSTEHLVLQDDSNCTKENDIEKFNEEQEADVQSLNESSVKLNYKEAKKVAREEYKEKKKELKSKHKKQNLKGYKIATIVLSILLLGATIVNVYQFILLDEESSRHFSEESKLNEEIESLETMYYELASDYENACEHQNFLLKKIGFYNKGDNQYHKFTCDDFSKKGTYWAHNYAYCEWLGYSAHSCIYEDDNKKWSVDDVDLSKYEIIE